MLKSLFENSRTALTFAGMVLVCAVMIAGTREDEDESGANPAEPLPEVAADMTAPDAEPALTAPPPLSEPGSRSDWYGPEPVIGSGSSTAQGSDLGPSANAAPAPGSAAYDPSGPVYGPDGMPLPLNPLATPVSDPAEPD